MHFVQVAHFLHFPFSACVAHHCVLFVCGPDLMYNALCGPRGDPEVTGLLKKLGYSKSQVYKF